MEQCEVVVGTELCPKHVIDSILRPNPQIREKWETFANGIGIPGEHIKKFRQELRLNFQNMDGVILGILEIWIGKFGRKAKLKEIIRVAEKDCNAFGVGEDLRLKFNLPCMEMDENPQDKSWNDLTPAFQRKVEKSFYLLMPSIQLLGPSKSSGVIVGGKDCSVAKVLTTIWNTNQFKTSHHIWSDLAYCLEVPGENIETIRTDLLASKININDAVHQVITNWVKRKREEAFLDELIRTLKMNGMDECSGELEKGFSSRELETSLPANYPVSFSKEGNVETILKSELRGQILIDLMTGKMPQLFKTNIPSQISYYIKRTIFSRCILSQKIFEDDSPDLFLVTGMERHALSQLVTHHGTNTSTAELDSTEVATKYILLDHANHFNKLCQKVDKSKSIHLIDSDKNQKLHWVKSAGDVRVLQKYILPVESQRDLDEDDFLNYFSPNSNMPVAISDSPGMGKTMLLSNIGRKLEKAYPERAVLFVDTSEFIQKIKQNMELENADQSKAIKMSLEDLTTFSDVGKAALAEKFKSAEVQVELLLDAFDEVQLGNYMFANDTLNIIVNSMTSIRLWVTTRPHYLEELENCLGVLGFNIMPFNLQDQINVLVAYWKRLNIPELNEEKLRRVAEQTLFFVKSRMNSDDEDIAGVPLQCLLIGEVFEEDAIDYALSQGENNINSATSINSIAELYQKLIQKKLDKYTRLHSSNSDLDESKSLLNMHLQLSIQWLFPEHLETLKSCFHEVQMDKILKIGIIEASPMFCYPRFIHRTFAEYFIAQYVVDGLSLNSGVTYDQIRFIVETVMECDKTNIYIQSNNSIASFKFINYVMCYFVNSSLKYLPSEGNQIIAYNDTSTITMTLSHACAHDSFLALFKKILTTFNNWNWKPIFDSNLILLSVSRSSREYIKYVIGQYEQSMGQRIDLTLHSISLRVAVLRGDYSMIDFLLKETHIKNLNELNEHTKFLIHDCIRATKYKSDKEIRELIQILKYIYAMNPSLLEIRDECQRTPLLAENVNAKLIQEIIALGADVLVQDNAKDTILHLSFDERRRFSKEDYHSIINAIDIQSRTKLINIKGGGGVTALMRFVQLFDPAKDTLELFHDIEADFNAVNDYGTNVLSYAVISQRNANTIKLLIKYGADIGVKLKDGMSILHVAAGYGNAEAVKTLILDYGIDANVQDEKEHTPLGCLLRSSQQNQEKRIEAGVVLHNLGGMYTCSVPIQNGIASILEINVSGKVYLKSVEQLEHFVKTADFNIEFGNFGLGGACGSESTVFKKFEMNNLIPIRNPCSLKMLDEISFNAAVSEFINRGGNYYYKDKQGNSLLHLAVKKNDFAIVKKLVDNSADINAENSLKLTPLHLASLARIDVCLALVKYFIDKGAAINKKVDCNTFLHLLAGRNPALSPRQFHNLAEYLCSKGLGQCFEVQGWNLEESCTPLHLRTRNMEILEETLNLLRSNGVDLNVTNKLGHLTLAYAIAGRQSPAFIKTLINAGTNVEHLDHKGNNILHFAAEYGYIEALKLLLEYENLDVNCSDVDGLTPLHRTVKHCKEDAINVCKILLENGANVNQADNNQTTALHYTTNRKDRNEALKLMELLIDNGAEVYARDSGDRTIMHMVFGGWFNIDIYQFHYLSKYLIDKNHHVLITTKSKSFADCTSFHLAVKAFDLTDDTLLMFHSAGVNFNARGNRGASILAFALCGKRSLEFLTKLISYGADITQLDDTGNSLLHFAITYSTPEILNFLLEQGNIDINSSNSDGYSPLSLASRQIENDHNLENIKLLLARGANPNHLSNNGCGVLHLSAQLGSVAALKLFLGVDGVDVNAKDFDGDTPLMCAVVEKDINILIKKVRILIEKGADTNALNKDGPSPLDNVLRREDCSNEIEALVRPLLS